MRPIEFINLSRSEAEELLCQVWRALEDHQIASPKLQSRWRGNRLNIALMFRSEADRATVAAELKRGAGSKQRSPESMTPA
jgi:hypothetical protein